MESKYSTERKNILEAADHQETDDAAFDFIFDVNLSLKQVLSTQTFSCFGLDLDELSGQTLFEALAQHPHKHALLALFQEAEKKGSSKTAISGNIYKAKSTHKDGEHLYWLSQKPEAKQSELKWQNERTRRLSLDLNGDILVHHQIAQGFDALSACSRSEDWMSPRLQQTFEEWNKEGTLFETSRLHERIDKNDWLFVFERVGHCIQLEIYSVVSQSLNNSGHFFEELWKHWPDPVMIFDTSGSRVWNNPAANSFAGKVDDLASFFQHFKTDAFLSLGKLWKSLTQEGMGQQFQALNENNENFMVHIDSVPTLSAFVLVLKPAQSNIGSQDLKVQSIAHDLRSPLANLRNLLLLQERTEDASMKDKLLKKAQESAQSLQKLLHGMLDRQSNQEVTNLKSLWEWVVNDLEYLIAESNPTIVAQIEVEETTARRSLVRSVLQNLLSNVLKYRSADRNLKISLSIKTSEDFLTIRMEDNGRGMDLSNGTDVLFGGYRQVGSSENSDSFGVGMNILKRKVEANMGSIKVNSMPNVGTVFVVRIPTEQLNAQQISLF